MKKTICLILVLLLSFTITNSAFAAEDKVYTPEQVTEIEGVLYDKINNTPVNGIWKEYFKSGALKLH